MKSKGWVIKISLALLSSFLFLTSAWAPNPPATPTSSSSSLLATYDKETAVSNGKEPTVRSAWYLWDPYQYEESITTLDEKKLTGLDVELTRALFKRVGYDSQ